MVTYLSERAGVLGTLRELPATASRVGCEVLVIEKLEQRVLFSAATPIAVAPIDAGGGAGRPALVAADAGETPLGAFGVVNGKTQPLSVNLGGGREAILKLTGGTGTAFLGGSDIHLEITDLGHGAALTVAVKGGGAVNFSNINVAGNLKLLKAPQGTVDGALNVGGSAGTVTLGDSGGDITIGGGMTNLQAADAGGTITVGGTVSKLKFGDVVGNVNVAGNLLSFSAADVRGTIYAGGILKAASVKDVTGVIASATQIGSLTAVNLSNATVLAGANLGSDGLLGGTGSAADSFAAGTIGTLKVNGSILDSFIGAGADPVDGIFGNGNDVSAGTGLIKSIFAKEGATNTQFEAGAFGTAKLPGKVVVTTDSRFIVL